jgi:DNA polymerase-1
MLVAHDSFSDAMRDIASSTDLAVDVETDGLYPFQSNRLAGVAIWTVTNNGYYFPFRHGSGPNLSDTHLAYLLHELGDPQRAHRLLGWNIKFDLEMLYVDGLQLPARHLIQDVMLAAHLMNENEPSFGLKRIADRYLGADSSLDEQELMAKVNTARGSHLRKEESWKAHLWELAAEDVAPYAIADVRLTWQLRDFYLPHLAEWRLDRLWDEMNEYLHLAVRMEITGIKLDTVLIEQHRAEATPQLERALGRLRDLTGDPHFNPASVPQLQAAFGWTVTDRDFLESIGGEAAELVLDWRLLSRLNKAYYEPYLQLIDPLAILRPNYNPIGTIMGRWSCDKPQLQAVPRRTEQRRVKDVFIARPGCTLIECDYSQAELRTASHYANERTMAEILKSGADLHQATADEMSRITGRPVDRSTAKRVNFSAVYGIGARKFSQTYRVPEDEARMHLSAYRARFPGFVRLYNQLEQMAREQGYIRLDSGRVRRYLSYDPSNPHKSLQAAPQKASSNWVQGTVAEVMRIAMQRIDRDLWSDGLRPIIQVHDSLLFECPTELVEGMLPEIVWRMTSFDFDPPPAVDVKTGQRWGLLEEALHTVTDSRPYLGQGE